MPCVLAAPLELSKLANKGRVEHNLRMPVLSKVSTSILGTLGEIDANVMVSVW